MKIFQCGANRVRLAFNPFLHGKNTDPPLIIINLTLTTLQDKCIQLTSNVQNPYPKGGDISLKVVFSAVEILVNILEGFFSQNLEKS